MRHQYNNQQPPVRVDRFCYTAFACVDWSLLGRRTSQTSAVQSRPTSQHDSWRVVAQDIVRQLDDVLIDAVIDCDFGAAFWREHFSRGELQGVSKRIWTSKIRVIPITACRTASVDFGYFARILLAVVEDDEKALENARNTPNDHKENAASAEKMGTLSMAICLTVFCLFFRLF